MKNLGKNLKDLLEVVLTALIITFILLKFVLFSATVQGSSMYSTLVSGDKGFSFVFTKIIKINRFDICVIDSDRASELLVKRVIGLPGETLEYHDNKLYINGEYLEETFLDDVYTDDLKVVLGENEYYCLGDNRNVSRDSRYYGCFTKEEIKSTGFFVYYPFNRIGVK